MSSAMNYDVTLKEAQQRFVESDLPRMALLSGATVTEDGDLQLSFLGQVHLVDAQGEVSYAAGDEEVPLTAKILLLHYLAQAQGVPVRGKLISFKELPGGAIYIEPFTKRAIKPMISMFGNRPESLLELGKRLGAQQASLGDVSICLQVLPYIPVTLVLWAGDEEFPPSGNILFDSSAANFLPTEDYAVLASFVVFHLKKLLNA